MKEPDEYTDYAARKTKANASAFISMALESNWDAIHQMDGHMKYIATRPRAERLGTHGLFGDEDTIDLDMSMAELNSYTGNVWTHIIPLRRGELMALQWDDLDFKTGVLNVSKQICDVKGELQLSTPKTKTFIRKLTPPPAVVEVLKEYRETVDSRWMFPSPVKEDCPMTPCAVRRLLHLILEHAGCKHVRFHDLRHVFATLSLRNSMDVKTLSAMLGHVSAATTLDIYTHITDDMRHTAASIDRGIGKVERQEDGSADISSQPEKPGMTDFKPYMGTRRKPGTGCISKINGHLFEGRYSPMWPDGKKRARNVYAKTRGECEEKLKELIVQMKAEIAEAQRLKYLGEGNGQPPKGKKGKRAKSAT